MLTDGTFLSFGISDSLKLLLKQAFPQQSNLNSIEPVPLADSVLSSRLPRKNETRVKMFELWAWNICQSLLFITWEPHLNVDDSWRFQHAFRSHNVKSHNLIIWFYALSNYTTLTVIDLSRCAWNMSSLWPNWNCWCSKVMKDMYSNLYNKGYILIHKINYN